MSIDQMLGRDNDYWLRSMASRFRSRSRELLARTRHAVLSIRASGFKLRCSKIDDRFPEGGFESDSLWIDALAETAEEVLQDNGYFCAKVSAQAHIWSSDAAEEQVSVTLQVAEGQQYRLGEIQFTRAQVFPPSELRNRVPLQDGDVFDLGKIRQGLVALNHLHSSLGYINFIAFPDIKIDDDLQYISVVFEIHEDKQYRVGSVEVLGLDREISDHALSIKLKPGDVFNPQFVKTCITITSRFCLATCRVGKTPKYGKTRMARSPSCSIYGPALKPPANTG